METHLLLRATVWYAAVEDLHGVHAVLHAVVLLAWLQCFTDWLCDLAVLMDAQQNIGAIAASGI